MIASSYLLFSQVAKRANTFAAIQKGRIHVSETPDPLKQEFIILEGNVTVQLNIFSQ
jgi:hypothetical protein